jgi:hypothetical protein
VGPQVAAKATRDALFLSTFAASRLPAMSATAALVSLLATLAFSRAMARLSPARVLPLSLGASSALFLVEWALASRMPGAAAVMVYLHQAILGAVLVSGFWSFVNERFDPHTAKRAMGAIGAGASLGGVVGGLVTWAAARVAGPAAMLPALAMASVLGLASVVTMRGARPGGREAAEPEPPAPASGFRLIRDVAYLRNLALLVGLCALVESLLDYLLGAAAAASLPRGGPLMSFFALLHGGTGVVALVLQAALARPALARLGVAGTLSLMPALTLAGSLAALAAPRLLAVVLLRGGQAALRNSFFRSAYELLYTPLPPEQKRPAKVLVDVACDRLGSVAGSAAVLLVLAIAPGSAPRVLLVLAAAAAGATLFLTPRFFRGYVGALAESLRMGAPALERHSIVDPATLLTLASIHLPSSALGAAARPEGTIAGDPLLQAIADLRSADPSRIRRIVAASDLHPALVPHLLPLLARDGLFEIVAPVLRRTAGRHTGQLVDALLDPEVDTVVRRRIARVLKGVPSQRAADGLLCGLDDVRFDVRYRCAQALARICAQEPAIAVPQEAMVARAARDAARAGESPRHLEHVFTMLSVVLDREALDIARRALRTPDERLRGTALEYLDNVLPAPVRGPLWPHLGARPAGSGRSHEEIRDDLLRSAASVSVPRRAPSG